jgi:hypothetical protein
MINDLRLILSFCRHEILTEFSFLSDEFRGRHVAESDQALPEHIVASRYQCLCPLTVLLRLISLSLSKLRIKARGKDWGALTPLQGCSVDLRKASNPDLHTDRQMRRRTIPV